MSEPIHEIFLKVSNVRCSRESLDVRFEGDKSDRKLWWPVETNATDRREFYKTITDGLDQNRVVLARLQNINTRTIVEAGEYFGVTLAVDMDPFMACTLIRIQHGDDRLH